MSVKVRCRCGQELQLRYGEWVYVLLGVVVLCLLVNSIGLLLLYLQLDRLANGDSQAERAAPERVETSAAGAAGDAAGATVGTPAIDESNADRARGSTRVIEAETRALSVPPADPNGAADSRRVGSGLLPSPDDSEPLRAPAPEDSRSSEHVDAPDASSEPPAETAVAVRAESPRGVFPDRAPLSRLFLLEREGGGAEWRSAFLLDGDARIRARAIEKLEAYVASGGVAAAPGPRALAWIAYVRAQLERDPSRRALASALSALYPDGDTPKMSGTDADAVIADLRSHADQATARERSFATIESGERDGLDLVILVDASESMKPAFRAVVRELAWAWTAIAWGLPGARLGVIVYRDRVVATSGFEVSVEEQLARIRELTAEGGGDVPEAVHAAVRASLGRGRFPWRTRAAKHVIVVGDAAPPYDEQRDLASLVENARHQEGVRFHAVELRTEGATERVPYFERIARAGGGTSSAIDPDRLGEQLFRCVFAGGSERAADSFDDRWMSRLETLFGS